ncbi:MAG: N-acetylneuraminate synthase family protein [Anaerolineaceae bacterium]|jgi:N-acetylneuraminate synthase|nr:N-acetylneuraminate synthase family protein [Anaerolineaceae bacterium]MDI9531640.1 N-acetylneuraminate synthase family protein [Chloroflexota bacterium]HOF27796.1 N-acetylneuraminate synthase family protein [Anaerolineaceae bacterium]
MELKIGNTLIGDNHPTWFIADIAANHDGSLERALLLIHLAAEAGADAAKFQNFRGPEIVSDYGFSHMNAQVSHQAKWKKTVTQVYDEASVPFEWTPILKEECDKVGITYFSSPYDFDATDMLDPYVPAYKIGSGDITWIEACLRMARKGKPVLLATGASTIGDVQRAVDAILAVNPELVLMQCNTNYTAADGNFDNIHLNVLKVYRKMWPQLILGLSDHTHGHATVLGAVALGARVIEKHFTDDNNREGPDHAFAMNPKSWAEMVTATRQLERAMGSANKTIAENEADTVVVQRRCLRAAQDIRAGQTLTRGMIDVLRPATPGAIMPYDIDLVVGLTALHDIPAGQELRWTQLG